MVEHVIPLLVDGRAQFDIALDSENANDAFMLQHFWQQRCYEQEVVHVMLRAIRSGDYCIDIGANVGFFTLLMSRLVGDTGYVLAFEPSPDNLKKLKGNLQRNNITNVTLIEQPAWCRKERVKFHLNADSSGSHCLWDPGLWWENKQAREHPSSFEIESVLVDDYVHAPVKLVKIDTEGAEQAILEGMPKTLAYYHAKFVIAEFNPFGAKQLGAYSDETLRAYMRDFGYDAFLLHPDSWLPALVPPKVEITHDKGVAVINVLFSTLPAVAQAYPKVPFRE